MIDAKRHPLFVAGTIAGLVLQFSAEEWEAAAATPGLKSEYAEQIKLVAEMRRKLAN